MFLWSWKRKLEVVPEFCYLGIYSLQEVAASWLQSHAANVHGATSANCFPFSPTAICLFWPEVRCTYHVWGVWCCMQQRLGPWRWIHWAVSGERAKDEVSSDSLLTKLGIQDLDVVLRTSRMRWFGHVERSTGWTAEVRKLNVVAQKRSGRPRKSWDEVLENDRKKLDMDSADPQNRSDERTPSRKTCQKSPTLGRGKQGSKMDMMMMENYRKLYFNYPQIPSLSLSLSELITLMLALTLCLRITWSRH